MRVTFVYPDLQVGIPWWHGYYYCGIGSLAGQVKAAGHRSSLIHITRPGYGRTDFLRDVDAAKPDLVAFSATTLAFPWVEKCTRWLRDEGIATPAICGGAHPSVDPENAIAVPGLDMICRGEGEGALLDLVDALQHGRPYDDIPNLWVKRDGEIHRNPVRPLIQDLDALAPYDRDDWLQFPKLLCEREGEAVSIASRGCPFTCTYCANHAYMELYGGKHYVRFRSVDNVIAELVSIVCRYPFIRGFVFDDDIFFMRTAWSEEFAEKYRKELGLPFTSNIRPNLCRPEVVALLKRANCVKIKVGIESGNNHIRNTLLQRGLDADDIVTAFHRLEEAGIRTLAFNMVGLPGETPANVLETVKLNAASRATESQVTIFYPFPGTRLAKYCWDRGYVRPYAGDIYDFFSDSTLEMETLTSRQIIAYRISFPVFLAIYRGLRRLPPGLRRAPERILDAIFTSRVHTPIAMWIVQPARQLYRYALRPLKNRLRQRLARPNRWHDRRVATRVPGVTSPRTQPPGS